MTNGFAPEYAGSPSYTGKDRIRPADLTSRWIPIEPLRPEHWTERGDLNCLGLDTNLFFPYVGGDAQTPKAVCNGMNGAPPCPVRDQCLADVIDNPLVVGVFGGTSEGDRKQIRNGHLTIAEARAPKRRGGGVAA